MPTSTQQKAKSLAQDWSDTRNQNFVDTRGANAQQQQKSDYYQQYNKQLEDQSLWAQRQESNKINQSRIDRETQGNQNAMHSQQRQFEYADQTNTKPATSTSSAFGDGAFQPSGYGTNTWGQRTAFNASEVADWNLRQTSSINSTKRFSKAQAAGDVLRAEAQGKAQAAATRAAADSNKYNLDLQAQQADKDRASRERLSLLQGYSVNPSGYQYWGGRV